MIHHSLMRSPHRFCMETFKRHISDFSENGPPAKIGKNGKSLFSYNFVPVMVMMMLMMTYLEKLVKIVW